MFFPVSKPSQVFEAHSSSIVGHENPSDGIDFTVRPLSTAESELLLPFSDLVTYMINIRGDLKDISNTKPVLDVNPRQGSSSVSKISDALALVPDSSFSHIRAEILRCLSFGLEENLLESDVNDGPNPILLENMDKFDIHRLAQNKNGTLTVKASENDNHLLFSTDINAPVGASDLLTPAETALRGEVVDISNLFNPSSQNDIELFGLGQGDDSNEDEDEDGNEVENADDKESNREREKHGIVQSSNVGNAMLQNFKIRFEEPQSQLDDELDTIIGETFGGGDLPALRRKKARLARQKMRNEDPVWAIEDTVDVSNFVHLVPEPAIEYPFSLDVFQKRAVYRLEQDESVFVAAHTSAGKTVVAEYAIALAMQRKTKVIYTSPIKTLSNQKFRDFTQRFASEGFGEGDDHRTGNVGIITGDISINPEADCLIMTTEILRSMLYKGADIVRDLSHVIFDECHWLNNPERGVVWEETIIMLPHSVTIVMLSATVPNAMEFAKWVGATKGKPVYVVHTAKRPVPLSHHIFVKGEVFKLFDSSQSRFMDANYRRAVTYHKEHTKNTSAHQGVSRHHAWMQIIKFLRKRDLDPVIFFCFSKKKCDEAADQLSTQDLTSGASAKSHIHQFYQNAIARLSQADRNVPQIARHREMLKRGIGVHHAGLLPILKEITEVLFQSGYVRVLFATETFAMGVNMPARTVVFTAIHKFDSESYRLLEPGEYIQMAGRAGRRGLDEVGTVLIYPSAVDFPSESDVKTVLTGKPKPLRSQFRLTYNMILNLLRIEELRVEDVMARSFSEAPAQRNSKGLKMALEKGSKRLSILQEQETGLKSYRDLFDLSNHIERLSQEIARYIIEGKNTTLGTLSPGRIVLVRRQDRTVRLAVIVKGLGGGTKTLLKPIQGLGVSVSPKSGRDAVRVITLLGGAALAGVKTTLCVAGSLVVNTSAQDKQFNCNGIIIGVGNAFLDYVDLISTIKIPINEQAMNPVRGDPSMAALSGVAEQLRYIAADKSYWNGLPTVHPVRDLGLSALDITMVWDERTAAVRTMLQTLATLMETGAAADLVSTLARLSVALKLETKLLKLRVATSDESLQLMPDYRQRAFVLQRLGYIDGTTVRLKGRAACEVNTCESIILTELVYEQVLQSLAAADLAAVLSTLVFTERLEEGSFPGVEELISEAPQVVAACKQIDGVLRGIGEVIAEFGVGGVTTAEYVRNSARYGFVKGVRDWAIGKSFAEVCSVYDGAVAEGTVVRTIVRLCELLRELKNVGRVVGDPAMQARAQEASDLCRRDVIFAASLYVT